MKEIQSKKKVKKTPKITDIEKNILEICNSNKSDSQKISSLILELLEISNVSSKDENEKTINFNSETVRLFDLAYRLIEPYNHKFLLKLLLKLIPKLNSNNPKKGTLVYRIIFDKINQESIKKLIYFGVTIESQQEIKNLCLKEDSFLEIRALLFKLIQENEKQDLISFKEEIGVWIFLFVITSNFNYKRDKILLSFERALAEALANFNKKSILPKMILKEFPDNLLAKKQHIQFRKSTYLWLGISEEIKQLSLKNQDLSKYCTIISEDLSLLKNKVNDLVKEIKFRDESILEKNVHIENLTKELVISDNILKFEKNKYEQQYLSLKKGLQSKITKLLNLEILGIEDILYNLPDKEKQMLKRRIDNIHQIINRIGEE